MIISLNSKFLLHFFSFALLSSLYFCLMKTSAKFHGRWLCWQELVLNLFYDDGCGALLYVEKGSSVRNTVFSVSNLVFPVMNLVLYVGCLALYVCCFVLYVGRFVSYDGCFVPSVWNNWEGGNLPESNAFCKSRRDLYKPRRDLYKPRRDLKVAVSVENTCNNEKVATRLHVSA